MCAVHIFPPNLQGASIAASRCILKDIGVVDKLELLLQVPLDGTQDTATPAAR